MRRAILPYASVKSRNWQSSWKYPHIHGPISAFFLQDIPGVLSAREFVWWYNGHPHVPADAVDLKSVKSVVICGLGNVALDCARILLSPPERLKHTDIAAHALAGLESSAVEHVHLVARRGPVQVKNKAL